jgi:hypothetical protein
MNHGIITTSRPYPAHSAFAPQRRALDVAMRDANRRAKRGGLFRWIARFFLLTT